MESAAEKPHGLSKKRVRKESKKSKKRVKSLLLTNEDLPDIDSLWQGH